MSDRRLRAFQREYRSAKLSDGYSKKKSWRVALRRTRGL